MNRKELYHLSKFIYHIYILIPPQERKDKFNFYASMETEEIYKDCIRMLEELNIFIVDKGIKSDE